MSLLRKYLPPAAVAREAEFSTLGYVDAATPGVLAFADALRYVRIAAENPNIACLITTPELAGAAGSIRGLALVESPRDAFYTIHADFVSSGRYAYPFEADRGENCRIHPSAIVSGRCRIGDRVVIGENVVIRDPVWIGSDVTIEPGVKLGVEGILYRRTPDGPRIIPHGGYLRIGNHAAFMSNSAVVRSVHDTDVTEVGEAVIVGHSSIVGHEAKISDHVIVSNSCVLARRCRIGRAAFIGTGAFVREHVSIGAGAQIMAGGIVVRDVAAGSAVSGNFATEHNARMMQFARDWRAGSGH